MGYYEESINLIETKIAKYTPISKEDYLPIYRKLDKYYLIENLSFSLFFFGFAILIIILALIFIGIGSNFLYLKIFCVWIIYMVVTNRVSHYAGRIVKKIMEENNIIDFSQKDSFYEVDADRYEDINSLCKKSDLYKKKISEVLLKREDKVLYFDYLQLRTERLLDCYEFVSANANSEIKKNLLKSSLIKDVKDGDSEGF